MAFQWNRKRIEADAEESRSRGQGGLVLVALTEFHGYGLVALANSPVTDLKGLKGKRVGITSAGSLTDNTLRYFFEEAGINPDRDLEITGVGTGGPMRAAIETGAVAAGMLTTPALGLLVVEKWSKANDASARALARAVVKAEQMVRTNRAAVDAALVEMYPALDPKLRAVLAEEAPKLLSADGRMAPAGYALMQRMLKVTDPAMVAVPYEQISASALLP